MAIGQPQILALKQAGTPEALAAVADWIRAFQPDPATILGLFDDEIRSNQRLDPGLRAATSAVAESWSADEKAELFETLASHDLAGEGVHDLLREGHVQEANPDRVARSLQQLFESSSNNEQRERVLRLWGIARPAPERAQRALADTVYIPLLDKGKEAVRLALTHFDLVQHMTGNPRDRVRKALQDAARGDQELGKRADAKLRQVGWIKRKKKWWEVR